MPDSPFFPGRGNMPMSGWRSRGYLPHLDGKGLVQSITFRLADSLPQSKLQELEGRDEDDLQKRRKIEEWLDAGMGCCALKHPAMAQMMEDTLLKFDGDRYRLIAWCIMPNHVHVLVEVSAPLAKIVQSWKSYTGKWAIQNNAELGLSVPGKALWMREYWDRYMRDGRHLETTVNYIEQNPVKAGLCVDAKDWRWSSAGNRNAEP